MSIKYQVKIIYLLTVLSLFSFLPALALNSYVEDNTELPLIKECKHSNIFKKKVAEKLSKWTIKTLEQSGTTAAVISRPGTRLVRMLDKTEMGHTGIVLWDSELNQWMVYNLFSNPKTKHRLFEVRRTSIYDFFYTQPNLKLSALMLIPNNDVQKNLISGFLSGKYRDLVESPKYNLISPIENLNSINCVEWVALNVFAAEKNLYNASKLMEIINNKITVEPLKLTPYKKLFLKFMPHVFWDEVPKNDYIKTIMVNNLYNLDLFVKKVFYCS